MIDDVILAVTHARNAQNRLSNRRDTSATNAFAEVNCVVDQVIESYTDRNNVPFQVIRQGYSTKMDNR
jgi:hypothetical protein